MGALLYTLWERVNASGQSFDVELVRVGDEPSPDAVRSPWLPTTALPRAMAVRIQRCRLNQIFGVGL